MMHALFLIKISSGMRRIRAEYSKTTEDNITTLTFIEKQDHTHLMDGKTLQTRFIKLPNNKAMTQVQPGRKLLGISAPL